MRILLWGGGAAVALFLGAFLVLIVWVSKGIPDER
jgi:hypothetical protein